MNYSSHSAVTQSHLAGHGQTARTPEETDMTLAYSKASLPAFTTATKEEFSSQIISNSSLLCISYNNENPHKLGC